VGVSGVGWGFVGGGRWERGRGGEGEIDGGGRTEEGLSGFAGAFRLWFVGRGLAFA